MIGRIWAIARVTMLEAIRMRVLWGLLVLVIGSDLFGLVLGEMSIRDADRVARDVGLASASLWGSLTAIFLGVFLLYTEVQRRTIHAIVSKPIERWEFVVGKYLGMACVLTLAVVIFGGVTLLVGGGMASTLVRAIVLAWFEILTVAAIAIFFSSFSTPFLSGIFALAIWVIGRLTPDIELAASTGSGVIRTTANAVLFIVPDLHLFSPSGRVVAGAAISVHGDFVGWGYVGMAGLHALGYVAFLLALACVFFQRRDFA